MTLLLVMALVAVVGAYKPVIMMHGLAFDPYHGNHHDFDLARKWIEAAHPGTQTFALELYEGLASLTNLDEQVKTVTAYVANLTSSMPSVFQNGYHIIGHSQGGLLMRCVIQNFDAHKVDRFISLAGVVNGYFGAPSWLRSIIGDYGPEELTRLLYISSVQKHFSMADMWKDPTRMADYLKSVHFLTRFSNEVNSTDSVRFKNNFCRVNMMSYFGSPADGVLSPYSTSLYGFFDKNLSYIPMEAQAVYLDDLFGLQTMMIAGRLSRHGLALCGEDLQDICFAIVDLKLSSGGRIKRELSQRALESGGVLRRGRSMQGVVDADDAVDNNNQSNNNDYDPDTVWGDVGSLPSSQRTSMTRGATNLLEYNQSNDAMFFGTQSPHMSQATATSTTTTKLVLPSAASLFLPDLTSYSQPLSASPAKIATAATVAAPVDSDEPTLEISPVVVERSPERLQRATKRSGRGAAAGAASTASTSSTRSAPKRAAAAMSKKTANDDDGDGAYDDDDDLSPKKTRKRAAPAKKRGAAAAAGDTEGGSPRRGRPTRLEQDEDPNRARVPHELSTGTLQAPPVIDLRQAGKDLQTLAKSADARQLQLLAWAAGGDAADAQLATAASACEVELRDLRRVCCAAELSMPLMALFLRLEQLLVNQVTMLDVLGGEAKHVLLVTKQPHMLVPFKAKSDQVGTVAVELFSTPHEANPSRYHVEGVCESTAKDWSEKHVKNASKALDNRGCASFDTLMFDESTRMEFVTLQFRAKLASRGQVESHASNPMIVVTNESQWPGAARKLLWQHTFGDVDSIPWPLFANYLNLLVVVSLYRGIETMVRALTPWELRFLHHRWFKSARVIEREAAIKFWTYFGPVLTALRFKRHIANMWEKGEMLGFMTKEETVALLRDQDTGTFCLRFSESVPGAFAVAYMTNDEADPIKHFLVKPTDLGHNRTLPDFLRDKSEFRIMLTLASVDDPKAPLEAPKDAVLKRYYKVTKGAAAQQLRAADGYVNV